MLKFIKTLNGALLLWTFSMAQADSILQIITTDKARYSPGEAVQFSVQFDKESPDASLKISYFHLNTKIDSQSIAEYSNPVSWTWQPPQTDYQGYLAEIILQDGATSLDTIRIAVDVSSDWSKFPRYGFLSKYQHLSTTQIENTIAELNRYHINGLQFYDWHYKHHMPLKGAPENPAESWNDIANRTNYFSTVAGYIKAAHERNMMAIAYNLLFGAYRNAAVDGVSNEWRLFKDQAHNEPDFHDLPSSWASDIYLIDPSNPQWISYIIDKTQDAFAVFDFNGWHIDQLGDRGTLYNYSGQKVSLPDTYLQFIQQTKNSLNTSLVMNSVNQYGQSDIAASPVDFLYTEVWPPNDSYSALVSIIRHNTLLSNEKLATVLAAYMNKARSSQSGDFNAHGVLLTDAVIFAAGGAHLELGEHMLANEYFPNDNLKMSSDLQRQLIAYYDFLAAYQNLLRDGGDFTQDCLQSESPVSIRNVARQGSIWCFSKEFECRQIFHLINFINAKTLNWRDDTGDQPKPNLLENVKVSFISLEKAKSLWIASPDFDGGMAKNIAFEQHGDTVRFAIPALKYWDMVVADYESISRVETGKSALPQNIIQYSNYPNPFNPTTTIRFELSVLSEVKLQIIDAGGNLVRTLTSETKPAGTHQIFWDGRNNQGRYAANGIYFCRLDAAGQILIRTMTLLR